MSIDAKSKLVVVPVNIKEEHKKILDKRKKETGHNVSKLVRHLFDKYLHKV